MSNKKEHKLDGVWDVKRVHYNVLSNADNDGFKTHGKTWGHSCAYQGIRC